VAGRRDGGVPGGEASPKLPEEVVVEEEEEAAAAGRAAMCLGWARRARAAMS